MKRDSQSGEFRALFGIEPEELGPNCVLLPFARRCLLDALGVGGLSRGKLYRASAGRELSVVVTGIGPALAGDAVLRLAAAGCRRAVLLGACGLVGPGRIGEIVVPSRNLAREAFSDWLLEDPSPWVMGTPASALSAALAEDLGARCTLNASVGSLLLSERRLGLLQAEGVESIEMECGAVLAAAAAAGIEAAAVLVVTDLVGRRPFYRRLPDSVFSALAEGARGICRVLGGS